MTKEEQVDWLCRLRADLNNGIIYTPWNKEFTEALTDVLERDWIYCSDRPPKIDGRYLVITSILETHTVNIKYFAKDLFKVDNCNFYYKKGISGWYDNDNEGFACICDDVIAWMPLPVLPKEGEING